MKEPITIDFLGERKKKKKKKKKNDTIVNSAACSSTVYNCFSNIYLIYRMTFVLKRKQKKTFLSNHKTNSDITNIYQEKGF